MQRKRNNPKMVKGVEIVKSMGEVRFGIWYGSVLSEEDRGQGS